jgi:hypothetical protein
MPHLAELAVLLTKALKNQPFRILRFRVPLVGQLPRANMRISSSAFFYRSMEKD